MKKLCIRFALYVFLVFQIAKNKKEAGILIDAKFKEIEDRLTTDDSISDGQFDEILLRETEVEGRRILVDLELKNKKLILWAQQKVDTL